MYSISLRIFNDKQKEALALHCQWLKVGDTSKLNKKKLNTVVDAKKRMHLMV